MTQATSNDTIELSTYMGPTSDSVRVPPHSIEAEQSVLGALMLDNAALDRVGDLLAERDFYSHQHRLIYGAIASLIAACQPADVITTFVALQQLGRADDAGGGMYLVSLTQSVPSAANVRHYARIVRERSVLRAVIHTADEASSMAWRSDDAAAVIDRAAAMFGELQQRQVRKMPRPIGEVALERADHYGDLEAATVAPGWPTGFPWLDEHCGGGLHPGDLVVLAARPSVGKSSLAMTLAANMARDGLTTLFLSLEMVDHSLVDRAVASLGGLSFRALMGGRMDRHQWASASDAMDQMSRLPLFVDDQPALTLRDVRAKARSVKGLKVLVIDYLQLMSGPRRDANRNNEIEEISRGLKSLAKELGIAVIALSQLNRQVEGRASKRPNLADLRDSGAIEQDADVVAFLWPVREFKNEGRRIVGLAIAKNRNGPLGEVGLDFFGDRQQWFQSTADIRPDLPSRDGRDDL